MPGRPPKAVVEYFPHYCADSKTKYLLDMRWPHVGYSVMYRLFELLGSSNSHFYDYNGQEAWDFLLLKVKVDQDLALEIIEALAMKTQTFDPELYQANVLWSQNFVDGLAPLYARRKTDLPIRPDVSVIAGEFKVIEPSPGLLVMSKSENPEADARIPEMITYYEDNVGQLLTPPQLEEMKTIAVEYDLIGFKDAVNKAVDKDPRPKGMFRYILGVLRNSKEAEIDPHKQSDEGFGAKALRDSLQD